MSITLMHPLKFLDGVRCHLAETLMWSQVTLLNRGPSPHGTMCSDLHWLTVRQRIQFKICFLVNECRHRAAAPYLSYLQECLEDLILPFMITLLESWYSFYLPTQGRRSSWSGGWFRTKRCDMQKHCNAWVLLKSVILCDCRILFDTIFHSTGFL